MKCHRCPNKGLASWRGYCKKHYQYLLRLEGRESGTVPVDEVLPHVLALHAAKMPWIRISELAGIGESHLSKIRKGAVKRVQIETAKAILAIELPSEYSDSIGPRARVPALGIQRRLQALIAMGYTQVQIAYAVEMHKAAISNIVVGNGPLVEISTARKITQLFQDWEMLPPSDTKEARRQRTIARQRGYAPPFAWDERSIDDPAAVPQMPKGDRDGWYQDYQELKTFGLDENQIAQRMGIRRDSLIIKLRRFHETRNRNQEHEQVRQGDEQMVCEDWQAVAGL